jgi:hypothetical protein
MSVLQNLNKEIDFALEEALFIVWWCSTNVQQPKTWKHPHITDYTWRPLNVTNLQIFPLLQQLSTGSKQATIVSEQVHNIKAIATKATCFNKLLGETKP